MRYVSHVDLEYIALIHRTIDQQNRRIGRSQHSAKLGLSLILVCKSKHSVFPTGSSASSDTLYRTEIAGIRINQAHTDI